MPDLFTQITPLPDPVIFAVAGEPRGKGRPRTRVIGKHAQVYTHDKTRAYEAQIKSAAMFAMQGRPQIKGPLHLEVVAYCGITESWTKREKEAALAGDTESVGRFDLDNIIKCAGDGMNGVVMPDDNNIVSICARKEYSATPRLAVAIVPATDGTFRQPDTVAKCQRIIDRLLGAGLLPHRAHEVLTIALGLYQNYHGEQVLS